MKRSILNMGYIKILPFIILIGIFLSGCGNTYAYYSNAAEKPIEESSKHISENNEADKTSASYEVSNFLDEDISEINLIMEKHADYDNGKVYSLKIDNNKAEEYGRADLGLFLFTKNSIYMLSDNSSALPSEEDFLSNGLKLYSKNSFSDEKNGWIINVHNDGYLCKCSVYPSTGESGFYYNYIWNNNMELEYFRSGYGAEGDPIEFAVKNDLREFFYNYPKSEITDKDFSFEYKGNKFTLDTSYDEYIDRLGYPKNYEDNNCGYLSNDDGYRWQLQYPDAGDYDYDIRIIAVSPEHEAESEGSYIDFIDMSTVASSRGISCGDSIYKLAKVYGSPDKIQPSDYDKYTDLIYEYNGNELIFTVFPDNTIENIILDPK